jgi:hypothetical protein
MHSTPRPLVKIITVERILRIYSTVTIDLSPIVCNTILAVLLQRYPGGSQNETIFDHKRYRCTDLAYGKRSRPRLWCTDPGGAPVCTCTHRDHLLVADHSNNKRWRQDDGCGVLCVHLHALCHGHRGCLLGIYQRQPSGCWICHHVLSGGSGNDDCLVSGHKKQVKNNTAPAAMKPENPPSPRRVFRFLVWVNDVRHSYL